MPDVPAHQFPRELDDSLAQRNDLGPIWDALALGQAARPYELDPALVPFWCPECRRACCGPHRDHPRGA